MTNNHHLAALRGRLFSERQRLASAKTDNERRLREVWIAQIEREIDGEIDFLEQEDEAISQMSDDELLAALEA